MDYHWQRQCDQLGVDASPPATNVPVSSSFLSDQSGGVPFDTDIDLILANMDAEEFPIQDPAIANQTTHHDPLQLQADSSRNDISSPSFLLDTALSDRSTFSNHQYEGSSAEESPCYSNPEFQFKPDCSSSYIETGHGLTTESIPHTTTSNQIFSASRTSPWNITTTNYHNEQTVDHTEPSCNLALHPVLLGDPEVRSRSHRVPSWRNGDVAPITTTRLSRESLQILKKWPGLNSRHTYPSEEETEMLQRRTGLSKTQIANWIVNARRRGKLQPKRSLCTQSPQTASTGPVDIPRRPDTPAVKGSSSSQDPLQRWVDSPPEDEPASVVAIARAMYSKRWDAPSAPFTSNYSPTTQEGIFSNDSSASSAGTSSAGSFTYSHSSGGSFQVSTFNSLNQINGRRRRRKRVLPSRSNQRTSLIVPLKPYQCTFCPETFKTKHDWQRHEKSFHLSLEMWICTPDEPRVINPKTQLLCCVFCGLPDPDDAHLEKHHHGNVCKMRKLEERTFYRKDHLNQHLKLVHNAMFLNWSMANWKIVKSEIRSRCGFCGIIMNDWTDRTDHLAEHFKSGKTMADWHGDWGFDPSVLEMLTNSIPPYLIENEQQSPFPFLASVAPTESPRNAYELITLELAYFMANHEEKTNTPPKDRDIQVEACRIIYASEVLSTQRDIAAESSWLRDLVMSSDEIASSARFAPLRRRAENRSAVLKINGKDNLFEQCPLEVQLNDFVHVKVLRNMAVSNEMLQEEACHIIRRMEKASILPCRYPADWLVRLVKSSTAWLSNFRQRAHLPPYVDADAPVDLLQATVGNIDIYTGLERYLGDYIDSQRAIGIEPSSRELERKAHSFIYQDGLHHDKVDNSEWVANFKRRHDQIHYGTTTLGTLNPGLSLHEVVPPNEQQPNLEIQPNDDSGSPGRFEDLMTNTFFLNDTDCYRRLAQELTRFVTSTMSPNNPNQNVPTDAEIQYQARWIMFDSDDPWNQTAAENSEWLNRFKRDVGILPPKT